MIHANDERLQGILLGQQRVLDEAYAVLEEEQRNDDVLQAVVLSSKGHATNRIARLDSMRVFSAQAIQRMCVRYGLRFLEAGRFKGKLPPRALYELRQLELRAQAPLAGFRIMAPAKRFKLCDCETDPLLFVPVGKDHYYLICKWGRDISAWRAVRSWPFRGPVELCASVFLLAAVCAALLPTRTISTDPLAGWWGAHRLLALLWTSMVCASFTVYGWFAFFGRFGRRSWNDPRLN